MKLKYYECGYCGNLQVETEFGECSECSYEELYEISEELYNNKIKRENNKMKVETHIGTIEVQQTGDDIYEGIWVEIDGVGLVLVEYDPEREKHVIRVWNSEDPDNDYEYIQVVK